jgi:hypothetical protein
MPCHAMMESLSADDGEEREDVVCVVPKVTCAFSESGVRGADLRLDAELQLCLVLCTRGTL